MSQVQFKDRYGNDIVQTGLTLVPQKWSGSNRGGYKRATIEAYGPREKLLDLASILRYNTNIFNDFGKRVWNGYVDEVIVYLGSVTIGFSVSGMANRVKVIYNTNASNSTSRSAYTDWFSNADSIDKYGYIERIISVPDTLETNAEQRAAQAVEVLGQPVQSFAFDGGGQEPYVRIECLGWYSTLKWRMFRELRGSEGHVASGSETQPLGFGFTSNAIGFNAEDNSIHQIGSDLINFGRDQKIRIDGSNDNDGVKTVGAVAGDELITYNTSIEFDADDMFDSQDKMNEYFNVDDMVKVTESSDNNGYYFVANVIPQKIETIPIELVTEAENPVVLNRGTSLNVDESLTHELPSLDAPYDVTILNICQSLAREFTASATGTWRVKNVLLKVKKVGSPSDNLQVQLVSNGGSHSYTNIETATVAGSNLPINYSWVEIEFSGNNTITGGYDYAIIISRTGSPSTTDYYEVQLDDESSESGVLFTNDGIGSWTAHGEDHDLIFQVTGVEETTEQMENVLNLSEYLDFYIEAESGLDDSLYMGTYESAKSKLEKLLDFGTSTNKQLVAITDLEQNLYIREQQSKTQLHRLIRVTTEGQIKDDMGNYIEDGELIFDRWVELDDSFTPYAYSANFNRTYIAECEWNDTTKTRRISSGWESDADQLKLVRNG